MSRYLIDTKVYGVGSKGWESSVANYHYLHSCRPAFRDFASNDRKPSDFGLYLPLGLWRVPVHTLESKAVTQVHSVFLLKYT
jgi:hypothetical protein